MLRKLYTAMLRCHMVERRAEDLAHAHKFKAPLNLRPGLEGTAVGSFIELRPGDAIAGELSFAAHMFAGEPLGLYLAELYGVRPEYLAFAPESVNTAIHLLPPAQTVTAQLNAAVGFALALKKAKRANVVLVLLPNSSQTLGYWHEAAMLAAAERLPVIFVSVSGPANANNMGNSNARQRAASYGIPGITVDGGDVVAMWRVAQESIHRARGGAGPTLIDSQIPAVQSNSRPHPGSDPLNRMQHYLEKRKLWKQSWKDGLMRQFAVELEEALSFFSRTSETR
jgi:acetoin:2,6-dichlorophenolindophenol oxidoreductase subunit alpha